MAHVSEMDGHWSIHDGCCLALVHGLAAGFGRRSSLSIEVPANLGFDFWANLLLLAPSIL